MAAKPMPPPSLIFRVVSVLGIIACFAYIAYDRSRFPVESPMSSDEFDELVAKWKEERIKDREEPINITESYVVGQSDDIDDDVIYLEDEEEESGMDDGNDENADGDTEQEPEGEGGEGEEEEEYDEESEEEDDEEYMEEEAKEDIMSAEKLQMEGFQKESLHLDLPCHLAAPSDEEGKKAPVPVILMSLGRSGTGSTWQIMGTLTGREVPSIELTGSGPDKSRAFFENLKNDRDGLWVLRYMCHVQKKFKKAGIVGFKWKPYRSIRSEPAQGALRLIASYDGTPIYVVRNRRNLLDVLISHQKHSVKNLPAHCPRGNKKCIAMQKRAGTNMELKTKNLLKDLETLTKEEDEVDQMLVDMGVPHVHVSYEKLYHGDEMVEEWRKIFHFIGRGPRKSLNKKTLYRAMHHQGTANPKHKLTLKNYKEVKDLLTGTDFERLLHRRHLAEDSESGE